MATNPTRQDAEHRLSNFIAYWVRAREDKAEAMAEHNKVIKDLEETIEALSAEIQGGAFQPTLPFDEPKKPTITLSESDPDLQAAQQEAVGPTEAPPDTENPTACVSCGHPEGVHGTTRKRGCMRAECDCRGYVHPDPLGIKACLAGVEPEKREAEL